MIVGSSVSMRSLSLFLMTLAPVVFAETNLFRHLQDAPPTCDDGGNDIMALYFCYSRNTDTCNDCFESIKDIDVQELSPDECASVIDSCDCPECQNEETAFQQTPGCKGENICGTDNSCPDTKFCNFDNGIEKGGFCECCIDYCRYSGLPPAGVEDCIKQCGDRTLAPTISLSPTDPSRTEKPTPSSPSRDLAKCYAVSDNIGSCGACGIKMSKIITKVDFNPELDFTPELCLDVVIACDCPVCLEEESAWLSTGECMTKYKDSKTKVQKTKKEQKVKSVKVQKSKKETKMKSAKLSKGSK